MSDLIIERVGGLGGFGFAGSHLHSRGEVAWESLSESDRARIDALFAAGAPGAAPGTVRDGFTYRITRGGRTIELPEAVVPAALAASVKDRLE